MYILIYHNFYLKIHLYCLQHKLYRQRYIQWWELIASHYTSLIPSDGFQTSSPLVSVTDMLIGLSTVTSYSVRDAVVEASFTIAKGLISTCLVLIKDTENLNRQIAAVQGEGTIPKGRKVGNAKKTALIKQKELSTQVEDITSLSYLSISFSTNAITPYVCTSVSFHRRYRNYDLSF